MTKTDLGVPEGGKKYKPQLVVLELTTLVLKMVTQCRIEPLTKARCTEQKLRFKGTKAMLAGKRKTASLVLIWLV